MSNLYIRLCVFLVVACGLFLPVIDFFVLLSMNGAPDTSTMLISALFLSAAFFAFYEAFRVWLSVYRSLDQGPDLP